MSTKKTGAVGATTGKPVEIERPPVNANDEVTQSRVEVLGNIGQLVRLGDGHRHRGPQSHAAGSHSRLRTFTQIVWVAAALPLVVLIAVVGGHWLRHPTVARRHARNPQMAHFYGAAPRWRFSPSAPARSWSAATSSAGESLAVNLDWVLWISALPAACSRP